jgi:phosphoglycolate phosphatase
LTRNYAAFFFDLDGTLTDSARGITNSVRHALTRLGIAETDRDRLTKFIGPPLLESFQRVYGFDEVKARRAVVFYRQYFASRGIFENKVYDGIPVLLKKLDAHGCRLAVATSKPTIYTERILRHFKIRRYFDYVVGSNMDLTRTFKYEIVAELLKLLPVSEKSAVMIGDRADDIMAARTCMIDSVAVRYGYGSDTELSEAKPTYIVNTVDQLTSLISGFIRK